MDILLLGAAAVVLLLLTVWIVWRPDSRDTASDTQEAAPAPPQAGQFEDEYTSATADLSAGGVAVTTMLPRRPARQRKPLQRPPRCPLPRP
jgi:hypothetical protein